MKFFYPQWAGERLMFLLLAKEERMQGEFSQQVCQILIVNINKIKNPEGLECSLVVRVLGKL